MDGIVDLRSCLEYQQNVLGVDPLMAQDLCRDYTPGDPSAPVPGGGTCSDFLSCFIADLPTSVEQAPQVIGGAIGSGIQAATGGSLQTLLLLVLGIGAVVLVLRVT